MKISKQTKIDISKILSTKERTAEWMSEYLGIKLNTYYKYRSGERTLNSGNKKHITILKKLKKL